MSDPVSVAKYETACSIEIANFIPFVEGLMWELIVKPLWVETRTADRP
jgi:hypothetical protein